MPGRAGRLMLLVLVLVLALVAFTCGCAADETGTTLTTTAVGPPRRRCLRRRPSRWWAKTAPPRRSPWTRSRSCPPSRGTPASRAARARSPPRRSSRPWPSRSLRGSVGGLDEKSGMSFLAKDGYEMTMSSGRSTTARSSPMTSPPETRRQMDDKLVVAIAYEVDGKAAGPGERRRLPPRHHDPENNQVTDGHWSVKWVTKVQVKALGGEWSLRMKGAIEDTIDRGSFESCAAANCHGVTWKDEQGAGVVGRASLSAAGPCGR